MKKLFESMAYALKWEGSIAVHFTNGQTDVESKRTTKLMKIVDKASPTDEKANPSHRQIDVLNSLTSILTKVQSNLESATKKNSNRLPLGEGKLIYVLTNCQEFNDSLTILEEQILRTMRALERFSNMYLQVGVQIIYFGDDISSYNALEHICERIDQQ